MSDIQQNNSNNERLLRMQACPMDASVNWDPYQDTKADRIRWYMYYEKLPLEVRWGLASDEIIDKIIELAKGQGIYDEYKLGELSRIVRENFFLPASDERLKARIQKKVGIANGQEQQLVEGIKGVIRAVVEIGKRSVMEVTEQIPIIPALKKYPELRNQEITKNNIKLFETKDFVTPSIGNWIDDYIQRKGAQAHNNIQRSDFIFNSENGRKLDLEDRKKLGVILDSYDNDNAINVNFEMQEVIFSHGFEPEQKTGVEIQGQKTEVIQETQEVPGPPQPQVDVMPEEELPLQQWKDQNIKSMQGEAEDLDAQNSTAMPQPQIIQEQQQNARVQEQAVQVDIKKRPEERILPYEKAQEIGWFGESTRIEDANGKNDEIKKFFGYNSPKNGENSSNQPKPVIRNYREVDNLPENASKHIVNLKEIV